MIDHIIYVIYTYQSLFTLYIFCINLILGVLYHILIQFTYTYFILNIAYIKKYLD